MTKFVQVGDGSYLNVEQIVQVKARPNGSGVVAVTAAGTEHHLTQADPASAVKALEEV